MPQPTNHYNLPSIAAIAALNPKPNLGDRIDTQRYYDDDLNYGGGGNSFVVADQRTIPFPFVADDGDIIAIPGTTRFAVSTMSKAKINVERYGAKIDPSINNQPFIQAALKSLGTEGGIVEILNQKIEFHMKQLVFPVKSTLLYYLGCDLDGTSVSTKRNVNELVSFQANRVDQPDKAGTLVNEWINAANFHPGFLIQVRKNLANNYQVPGGDQDPPIPPLPDIGETLQSPVRDSFSIQDEDADRFRILYQNWADPNISRVAGLSMEGRIWTFKISGVKKSDFPDPSALRIGDAVTKKIILQLKDIFLKLKMEISQ